MIATTPQTFHHIIVFGKWSIPQQNGSKVGCKGRDARFSRRACFSGGCTRLIFQDCGEGGLIQLTLSGLSNCSVSHHADDKASE